MAKSQSLWAQEFFSQNLFFLDSMQVDILWNRTGDSFPGQETDGLRLTGGCGNHIENKDLVKVYIANKKYNPKIYK